MNAPSINNLFVSGADQSAIRLCCLMLLRYSDASGEVVALIPSVHAQYPDHWSLTPNFSFEVTCQVTRMCRSDPSTALKGRLDATGRYVQAFGSLAFRFAKLPAG